MIAVEPAPALPDGFDHRGYFGGGNILDLGQTNIDTISRHRLLADTRTVMNFHS